MSCVWYSFLRGRNGVPLSFGSTRVIWPIYENELTCYFKLKLKDKILTDYLEMTNEITTFLKSNCNASFHILSFYASYDERKTQNGGDGIVVIFNHINDAIKCKLTWPFGS